MTSPAIIVVLGAGASTGCIRQPGGMVGAIVSSSGQPISAKYAFDDVKPPITSRLVTPSAYINRYVSRYPDCQNVVDALHRALASGSGEPVSLEDELAKFESRGSDHAKRQLLAFRFYLRDLLLDSTDYMLSSDLGGGPTLYTELVDRCYEWARGCDGHVCFVSFNYDLLLEHACATTWKFNMRALDEYCSNPWASVVKPHGSALWERRLKGSAYVGDPVLAAINVLQMTDGFELEDGVHCYGDQGFFHASLNSPSPSPTNRTFSGRQINANTSQVSSVALAALSLSGGAPKRMTSFLCSTTR